MPRLVIEKGIDKGKSISLTGKDTVVIGRETTADLRLSDSIASRLHFRIESRPDGYYIIDLKSLNGTFVNGQRIQERLLKIGDNIQIGEILFSFFEDVPVQKQGPIGQSIGGYKIVERIGRGGMGTVYKGLQLSLNRVVALKILSEELVKDKTFINLFIQEARAAAQLNHPNIVQVYDVGADKEMHYFSMEFLSGGNLEDIISKQKKLPLEEALDIILQAARGLEYAEKKRLVHRDIKPGNLMIGEGGVIKICDLGLARSLQNPFEQEQSINLGTPHYVAPEQALGKPVDHRVDIYSLGCTFYRFVTGITPYSGYSIKEIIAKKLKQNPTPVKQLEPCVSNELGNIIDKMTNRDPDKRFQSVSEIVRLLDNIKGGKTPLYEPRLSVPGTIQRRWQKDVVNNLLLPAILFILSGLSVFLIIWYFYAHIKPYFIEATIPDDISEQLNLSEEDRRAQGELKEAELYLKSMDVKEAGSFIEAINRYERIIKEYPNSKLIPKVQARINELNNQVNRLEVSERLKYLELKAEMEFTKLIKELKKDQEQLINDTKITEVSPFVDKWSSKLTDFKNTYAKTTLVFRAEEENKQIQTWGLRIDYARKRYEEVEQQVNQTLTEGRINKAFNLLTKFINDERHQGMLYDKLAQDLLENVKKDALADFQSVSATVSTIIKLENFEEARQLLREKQGRYGIPEVEQQVKNVLLNVDRLIKERSDTEYKRLLEADRRSFYPAYIDALALVHQGDFANAEELLKGIKVQTDYYKTRIKNIIYEISCEQETIETLKNNAQKLIKNRQKLRNQRIEKITKDGIIIQGGKTVPWSEITASEFYDLMTKGWQLSPNENLKLGVLCLKRGGRIEEVNNSFNKARTSNQDYEEYLKEERELREKDASFILTQADNYYDLHQYFNALKCYNLIRFRFTDTELYKNNSNLIEEMIKKIGRNLNEKNNSETPPK